VLHLSEYPGNKLGSLSSKTSLCDDTCTSVESQDQIQQLFTHDLLILELTIGWVFSRRKDIAIYGLTIWGATGTQDYNPHLMILSRISRLATSSAHPLSWQVVDCRAGDIPKRFLTWDMNILYPWVTNFFQMQQLKLPMKRFVQTRSLQSRAKRMAQLFPWCFVAWEPILMLL
jgi:hypothetical protein